MSENLPEKSDFQIMDEADAQQIIEADSSIKQALVYESKGKRELTYTGVKYLVLKMSEKGNPLGIMDMPKIELVKYDPENDMTWVWQATIKCINKTTGLESIGASEQYYNDRFKNNAYDTFGRIKAISKAERNAFRKQIPELEIKLLLDSVKSTDVQKLQTTQTTTTKPPPLNPDVPSKPQLDYLTQLNYKGETPKTKQEASDLIQKLKDKPEKPTEEQIKTLEEAGCFIPETKKEAEIILSELRKKK